MSECGLPQTPRPPLHLRSAQAVEARPRFSPTGVWPIRSARGRGARRGHGVRPPGSRWRPHVGLQDQPTPRISQLEPPAT